MRRDSATLTLVGYWWVCLSIVATLCLCVGFYVPHWIVGVISMGGQRHVVYFGAFRRCNYPIYDKEYDQIRMSTECGVYADLTKIPSAFWKFSALAIGVGCLVAVTLSFVLIPSCCLKNVVTRGSAVLFGLFQVVAAVSVSVGCILYPIGWDNQEVRDACGPYVAPFFLGECQLGWAYICMLMGAALLLVCGMLSACSATAVNSPPSTVRRSSRSSTSRSRRDISERTESFDAETIIDNNLCRPSARSRPPTSSSQWYPPDSHRSPFVQRHSDFV